MKRYQTKAWIEAVADTALGTVINFPLNILLLWMAARMQLDILQTSIMLSMVFIMVAIVRKTVVRCYFHTKDKN